MQNPEVKLRNKRNVAWKRHCRAIREIFFNITKKRFREEFSNNFRDSFYLRTNGMLENDISLEINKLLDNPG